MEKASPSAEKNDAHQWAQTSFFLSKGYEVMILKFIDALMTLVEYVFSSSGVSWKDGF